MSLVFIINSVLSEIVFKQKKMDKSQKKEKRRDKSDLGPNFVAPDGRWGWFVVVAAGCSNVTITSSK